MARTYRADFWRGVDHLLGTMPDQQLADKFEVPRSVIGRRRVKLGIKTFVPAKKRRVGVGELMQSWRRYASESE